MPITPTSTKSKQYQALGIDEIANDIETAFEAINELEAGGGSEYTETIVNISSAQILAMGASPIQLLPQAGAGKYYDIDKIVLEYTHVTTPYTFGEALKIKDSGNYFYVLLASDPIAESSNSAYQIDGKSVCLGVYVTGETGVAYSSQQLNSNIVLTTRDGSSPTDGNGTLRVKIYHKTVTFGA